MLILCGSVTFIIVSVPSHNYSTCLILLLSFHFSLLFLYLYTKLSGVYRNVYRPVACGFHESVGFAQGIGELNTFCYLEPSFYGSHDFNFVIDARDIMVFVIKIYIHLNMFFTCFILTVNVTEHYARGSPEFGHFGKVLRGISKAL